MFSYAAAALASVFWALGTLVSFPPAQKWGSLKFNIVRQSFAFGGLFLIAVIFFPTNLFVINTSHLILMLSGIVGMFIGDFFLFITMSRLGPRKTTVLFSFAAPIAFLMSIVFSNESYRLQSVIGSLLIVIGIIIAVFFKSDSATDYEPKNSKIFFATLCGILAATGQAGGLLLLKVAAGNETNAVIISFWRVAGSALCYYLLFTFKYFTEKNFSFFPAITDKRNYFLVAMNAFMAIILGVNLVSYASIDGKIGIVATLSSMSPIFVLPVIWLVTKENPGLKAWGGAILAVIGMAIIFNG